MSIRFNASEVLAMAVKTEQNGAAFYRKAAKLKGSRADTDFLLELAAMEDGHAKTFDQMRKNLTASEREETAYDPDNQTALYLGALADGHGGEGAPSVAARLTGKESLRQILETAVALEKQAILFYVGLLDLVPAKLGQDKIGKVIDEEKSHVVVLTGELKKLRK